MGWTLHMIMCVLLCYPVSFQMLQLLLTGRPISSLTFDLTVETLTFKICPGNISKTIKCRRLMLGRDIEACIDVVGVTHHAAILI